MVPDPKTVAGIKQGTSDSSHARVAGSYVDDGLSGSETEDDIPQVSDLDSDTDASSTNSG